MSDLVLMWVMIVACGFVPFLLGVWVGTARCKMKHERNTHLRRGSARVRRSDVTHHREQAKSRSAQDHAQARFEAHQQGEGINDG
jgi:hypothetical protein